MTNLPLFAYRGMLCRIAGFDHVGVDRGDMRTFLYTLVPVHGGAEIPNVRWDQFRAAGENVFPIFPPRAAFVAAGNERINQ